MLKKIKALCIQKDMTVSEVCRKAKVSQCNLYKWDESYPSVDKVLRIAKVLGTTVEYLCEE